MNQSFITLVIPFSAPHADVDRQLDALGNPAQKDVAAQIDQAGVIHFMSAHAIPARNGASALLVIELSVDGGVDRALERLAQCLGERLLKVLASAGVQVPANGLAEFLIRHHQPVGQGWFSTTGLNFSGTPGMTVERIRREHGLAQLALNQLDRAPRDASALEKLAYVREQLWRDQHAKWAFGEESWPFRDNETPFTFGSGSEAALATVRALIWPYVAVLAFGLFMALAFGEGLVTKLLLSALVVMSWLVLGALSLGAVYGLLRRREKTDVPDDVVPSAKDLAAIIEREDKLAQNHLLVLSDMKAGGLRAFLLRLAFFAVGQLVTRVFRPGFLSQIGTIHFARWIMLPGTSQLLFLSNYGGSWESYLEDFIRRAHEGLTGVWSNTQGFPRAKSLFWEGATDGARFKAWARRQQRPTRFWYSAYPQITTGRIRTNAEIRRGIASARSENEAARWLNRFGAPMRPTGVIECSEVSALVFNGMGDLRFAKCFLVRLGADRERARRWLSELVPHASYGEDGASAERGLAVAFNVSGLRKLGLDDEHLAAFPVAFQHDSERRCNVLGDAGADAPAGWDWGNADKPVDAVVLLYARSDQQLRDFEAKLRRLPNACFDGCHEVRLDALPESGVVKEHFGFVDGISQPIIRGTFRSRVQGRGDQFVEPGEMILGYRDGLGHFPPTPLVGPGDDPHNLLAETGFHASETSALKPRNLGLNGTYLVVRQLEQRVDDFNKFLEQAAEQPEVQHAAPAGADRAEWIAAKMVGRWRNGTSLVRYPTRPGPDAEAKADNDFLFGVEDPDGVRCPFGAHVRRANPRDSFQPGSKTQLSITDRHRVLRVGRPYARGNNGRKEPGLFFMCVNSDIERQFEFVQQSWVRAPGFHGLDNEVDPIFVRRNEETVGAPVMTIPTAHGPIALRGMAHFVTLIGSGYFFLPGKRALRYLAR